MRKKFVEDLEILRSAKKYDRDTGKFVINIAYKTRTLVTPRTVAVSEAFGLGVDEHREHVIYDNVELKIGPQDIVYITGESGSGKSVLLRELAKDLREENVTDITRISVSSKLPLVDTLGRSFNEALELLCRVGLNDAFLFVRRYDQLSDGQKYRYKLAKLIEDGAQYWVMDEFCSTLDRDTAKIVAFNVQKQARHTGRAVLAATCHGDLLEDLAPSVYIHKGLGKKIVVRYFPNEVNRVCSVTRGLHVEEGSLDDWRELEPWHYRQGRPPPAKKVFTLKRGVETVGVIVYSWPSVIGFGRWRAFGRHIPIGELNRDFSLISRVVLHPKYRSIGLGSWLVRETLHRVGTPFVETVAVMARYNPFFEKAGITKVAERVPDKTVIAAVEELRELGFNPVFLSSEKNNLKVLLKMSKMRVERVKAVLSRVGSGYYKRLVSGSKPYLRKSEFLRVLDKASLERLAHMLSVLSVLAQVKVYFLWRWRGGGSMISPSQS